MKVLSISEKNCKLLLQGGEMIRQFTTSLLMFFSRSHTCSLVFLALPKMEQPMKNLRTPELGARWSSDSWPTFYYLKTRCDFHPGSQCASSISLFLDIIIIFCLLLVFSNWWLPIDRISLSPISSTQRRNLVCPRYGVCLGNFPIQFQRNETGSVKFSPVCC